MTQQNNDRQKTWEMARAEVKRVLAHLTVLDALFEKKDDENKMAIRRHIRHAHEALKSLQIYADAVKARVDQHESIPKDEWDRLHDFAVTASKALMSIDDLLEKESPYQTLLHGAGRQLEHFTVHLDSLRTGHDNMSTAATIAP